MLKTGAIERTTERWRWKKNKTEISKKVCVSVCVSAVQTLTKWKRDRDRVRDRGTRDGHSYADMVKNIFITADNNTNDSLQPPPQKPSQQLNTVTRIQRWFRQCQLQIWTWSLRHRQTDLHTSRTEEIFGFCYFIAVLLHWYFEPYPFHPFTHELKLTSLTVCPLSAKLFQLFS